MDRRRAPGAGDDAVIPFGDITVTHSSGENDTVDSINCQAALDLTSGSLTIDTTSASQPGSTISGQFNLSGASLQLLAGNLSLTGGGTISGAAGTNLDLNGQDLTASSVISSQGSVALYGCAIAGSYSAAGDTSASDTTFTGTVALGTSLEVSNVTFAPAVGGPVTLTTGTMSIGGTLSGPDSFVANGLLCINNGSVLSVPEVDAYGGMEVDATNPITLDGTTLNNYGAATWHLNGNPSNSVLESGAVINNLAGASLTMEGDRYGGIVAGDSSAVAFNNEGSFTCSKTGGANGFAIQVPFVNSGSVYVEQGSPSLNNATNVGAVTVSSGTSLGGGSYTQMAGSTVLRRRNH